MEMKDATPLIAPQHMSGILFKCKQYIIHDPRGPERYNYTMM